MKSVFCDYNFSKESFDNRFRNILSFFRAGILREGIFQNRKLLFVVFDHLGFAFLGKLLYSLLISLQMMFSFMMAEDKTPLRMCDHCDTIFVAKRKNQRFCCDKCRRKGE